MIKAIFEQIRDQVNAELERIREEHGEAAYQEAVQTSLKMGAAHGGLSESILREMLGEPPQVEPEPVQVQPEQERQPLPPVEDQPIALQVRGCRSKAQQEAMSLAFASLKAHIEAVFDGQDTAQTRQALERALISVTQATEITNKLRDVPEAATGPVAETFKEPPRQRPDDVLVLQTLLGELQAIQDDDVLTRWYVANRGQMETIQDKALRNELFDAIRAKRCAT